MNLTKGEGKFHFVHSQHDQSDQKNSSHLNASIPAQLVIQINSGKNFLIEFIEFAIGQHIPFQYKMAK